MKMIYYNANVPTAIWKDRFVKATDSFWIGLLITSYMSSHETSLYSYVIMSTPAASSRVARVQKTSFKLPGHSVVSRKHGTT